MECSAGDKSSGDSLLEHAESERVESDWNEKVTSIGLRTKRKGLGRHERGEVELRDAAADDETPFSSICAVLKHLARVPSR